MLKKYSIKLCALLGLIFFNAKSINAQTELGGISRGANTTLLVPVNGNLAWKSSTVTQSLITYDLDTKTEVIHDELFDITNLESFGDFAVSRAREEGGLERGYGMLITDGQDYDMIIDYDGQQGEDSYYHGGVIYQIAKSDQLGASTATNRRKLWAYSDGVGGQLSDTNDAGVDFGSGNLRAAPIGIDGDIVFRSSNNGTFNLFRTDGNTVNLAVTGSENIVVSDDAFYPISENLILFLATDTDESFGEELYKYDGTDITLVEDLITGATDPVYFGEGFVMDGYAYILGNDNTGSHDDRNLYRSNGTSIDLVTDFSASGTTNGGTAVNRYTSIGNGKLVLQMNDIDVGDGQELWVSDGTSVGTFALTSGLQGIDFVHKVAEEGAVFKASDGSENGVYYTDGTIVGTVLISDLLLHNGVRAVTAIGSKVYFNDNDNKVFELDIPVPGTTTYTTTWDLGVPTFDINAIVDGALVVDLDEIIEIQNLEVTTGNSITVESGASLVVYGDIFNEGTITIESGASLITYDEEYVIGSDIIIERNTSYDDGRYSFIGLPIETDGSIVGADLGSNVYKYNETTAYDGDDGLSRWENASTEELVIGMGYTQTSPLTLSFVGTPNTGDIYVDGLTHTVTPASGTTATAGNRGWNLVSNPYAAAIDVTDFLSDNSDMINGSIYIWDDNGSNTGVRGANTDYIVASTIATIAGRAGTFDGYIGSVQGFFVQVTDETSDAYVAFYEDQRVAGNINEDASFFRKREEAIDENPMVKIAMDGDFYNEIAFGFRGDATVGFDKQYDAMKLVGNSNIAFYSLMADDKYAIQGLPSLVSDQTINLGYDLAEASSYTFDIVEMRNLPDGYDVVLTDLLNGEEYILTDGSATLTLSAGSNTSSLAVSFRKSDVLSLEEQLDNKISVYLSSDNLLNIQLSQSNFDRANINILDIMGRKVASVEDANFDGGSWKGEILLQDRQIYIISIDNGLDRISTRIIK